MVLYSIDTAKELHAQYIQVIIYQEDFLFLNLNFEGVAGHQ